ncbi:MAG TPA: CheR family methyltransferase [Polyangiaceae bacterium]|nr:CheR family methyltransferase [Polyangiaceae bacterium]
MNDVEHAEDPRLESLLQFLKTSNGFDFTGYKRSSLKRRILKRMQAVHMENFDEYRRYLEARADEFVPLFNTVLINVSSFFRDSETWSYLQTTTFPRVLEAKLKQAPVRIWSAACASGQEPYSIAMALAELVGVEEFCRRVKIYATDLDEDALEQARHARYDVRELENVPAELRNKYFSVEDQHAVFHSLLRRCVIFGRHDLVSDAPISHVDLLFCRNSLMYFNLSAQSRVLGRLHFALNDPGYLVLGRAEMLLSHSNLFTPVELKHRIFAKVPGAASLRDVPRSPSVSEATYLDPSRLARLREAACNAAPVAQIVVDDAGRLAIFNDAASVMFNLGRLDCGKPLQNLEVSYRPVELRSLIDQARETGATLIRDGVECKVSNEDTQYLEVTVAPLVREGNWLGASVTFNDVTQHQPLQQSLLRFGENLETAYEELQSSNEELETTNEELQSSNEELETTNEELQAANEEMETINEELRSTNEELSNANEQLRRRELELNQANSFLNSVFGGLRAAVAVTDSELKLKVWSQRAVDFWGLREDEVLGLSLLDLDIGLPVKPLEPELRACIESGESGRQVNLDAVNRRGRAFCCRVSVSSIRIGDGQRGAILLMEDDAIPQGGRPL